MIYVTGGIYGDFENYRNMLEKLDLKEDDALFVLGGVVDFGKDGIKILKDMMYRPNIYPVLGKHEYSAKILLSKVEDADSVEKCAEFIDEKSKSMFASWLKDGGYPTLEAFLALSEEDKESILDYLGEFEPYEEIDAGGRRFVLAGSGIRNFDSEKDLDDYDETDFLLENADYGKIYYKDKFLITGGTPTEKIPGGKSGKIFSAKRHLAINCSASDGGRLAAVCLDTMKVYYV